MRTKTLTFLIATLLTLALPASSKKVEDKFPDGTTIPEWFNDISPIDISKLGKEYKATDYGIVADGKLHTTEFQQLIDKVHQDGGGVIILPPGTYHSGALFFKQGVHLNIQRGATLMGSDNCSDFPIIKTRIEGETCLYYSALINADSIDGFTITGEGTIDGNGLPYWRHFWERRTWNPKCTNKDEQRPRLVYISNCKDVRIEGITLQNSPFWTTHLYRSSKVKLLNLRITSPAKPVKAPSTDAVDIDACNDVLIKHCYMSVNDDAVALKGGKGPWADDPTKSEGNGENKNIIIEDCEYGFCHGCLTCGSESVHNRNIILRNIKVTQARNLLWLKMRPDTPQLYEYITVSNITGSVDNMLLIRPWTQFYDLKDRKDIPMSIAQNIVLSDLDLICKTAYNVERKDDQYKLIDFTIKNVKVKAENTELKADAFTNIKTENVIIEKITK